MPQATRPQGTEPHVPTALQAGSPRSRCHPTGVIQGGQGVREGLFQSLSLAQTRPPPCTAAPSYVHARHPGLAATLMTLLWLEPLYKTVAPSKATCQDDPGAWDSHAQVGRDMIPPATALCLRGAQHTGVPVRVTAWLEVPGDGLEEAAEAEAGAQGSAGWGGQPARPGPTGRMLPAGSDSCTSPSQWGPRIFGKYARILERPLALF